MSTSAPSQSASPSASTPAPTLDSKLAEKRIAVWHRLYLLSKPLEQRVDDARDLVTELLVSAGVATLASKHGTFALQTKDTVDWQALARAVIKPELLDQYIKQFTTTSKPFVRAPSSWSGEAKAKR